MTIKEFALNAMWVMLSIFFVTTTVTLIIGFFKSNFSTKNNSNIYEELSAEDRKEILKYYISTICEENKEDK